MHARLPTFLMNDLTMQKPMFLMNNLTMQKLNHANCFRHIATKQIELNKTGIANGETHCQTQNPGVEAIFAVGVEFSPTMPLEVKNLTDKPHSLQT